MKKFNFAEKATIKNNAKGIAFYQAKVEKLDEQIQNLEKEKESYNRIMAEYEDMVVRMTGFKPLDLVEPVMRNNQKVWTFKFPNTIIPVPTTPVETDDTTEEAPIDVTEAEEAEAYDGEYSPNSEAVPDTNDTDEENIEPDPFL